MLKLGTGDVPGCVSRISSKKRRFTTSMKTVEPSSVLAIPTTCLFVGTPCPEFVEETPTPIRIKVQGDV